MEVEEGCPDLQVAIITDINTYCFLIVADSRAGEESAITAVDHAVIGGVVAVVVFAMLCLLIILGRYFARHKGKSARIGLN